MVMYQLLDQVLFVGERKYTVSMVNLEVAQ